MRKTTVLTVSLVFLGVLPAMAQLGNVWTSDFQYYAIDLQNYLRDSVAETSKPAEYETQNAITTSTGDLNLPDPVAAAKSIHDDVVQKSISGTFESNPSLEAMVASNEVNREITRGAVKGILGANGQIRLKAKLNNMENSIKNITESIEKAQENNNLISQALNTTLEAACQTAPSGNLTSQCSTLNNASVQLQLLKVQGEQAKIVAETFAQTMGINNSLQYSNLNLANVSQQIEQSNRARRVDTSAEAARLLRATSQIDLLGRENQNE